MSRAGYLKLSLFWWIFILMGVALTVQNIADHREHQRLVDIAIPVSARVTRVDRSDEDYRLYLSYECGGKAYSDVYYATRANDALLGREVVVMVDPGEPSLLMPDDPGFLMPVIALIFITPAAFGFVVTVSRGLALHAASREWPRLYGYGRISEDLLVEDLANERESRRDFRIWMAGGFVLLGIAAGAGYHVFMGTLAGYVGFVTPTAAIALLTMIFLLKRKEETVRLLFTRVERRIRQKDEEGRFSDRCELSGINEPVKVEQPVVVSFTGRDGKCVQQVGREFHVAMVDGRIRRFFCADEFCREQM